MKILHLAHRIPYPPNKGDKLRSFRHIEHLSRSHDVTSAFFVDDPTDWSHVETLRSICRNVVAVRLRKLPATVRGGLGLMRGSTVTESFYAHRGMDRAMKELCNAKRFDVVVAFSSSMANYALRVPARRRILDLCDCDSRKWLAYAESSSGPLGRFYRTEGERLQTKERRWARTFDATLLITQDETKSLRPFVPEDRLHVVGNGVLDPGIDSAEPRGLKPAARSVVGFIGVMDYRPNVDAMTWFVDNCWSEIREAIPGAELRIVGRSPNRQVRALARVPGVSVVGEVPDPATELDRFAVSIAPMRIACGLQNKVLEAMVHGLPVVMTQRAAQAVGGRDGEEFLVADTADRFIRSVVRVLRSPDEAARIGCNAREFVLRHFRWDDQLCRLEQIVTGGTRSRSAPAATLAFKPLVAAVASSLSV